MTITRNGSAIGIVNPGASARSGVPYPFRNFDFGSYPKNLKTDAAEIIIAERERERSGIKYRL